MELTVRELKRGLTKWTDDTEIVFGGTPTGAELVFSHFTSRGEKILHIELIEEISASCGIPIWSDSHASSKASACRSDRAFSRGCRFGAHL
jgi:hypothetical protein